MVSPIWGLLILMGIFGGSSAECDATCQQNCANIMAACRAPFYAARQTAQTAQQRYMSGTSNLATPQNPLKALQAACDNPEQNIFDTCSNVARVVNCIDREMPGQCMEYSTVQNEVDAWRRAVNDSCPDGTRCGSFDLLKCQCHVLRNVSDPLGSICPGFKDYLTCVHKLPDNCGGDAKPYIDFMTSAYRALYYLRCLPSACPKAVDCTNSYLAPTPEASTYAGVDAGDGFLYISAGPHFLPVTSLPDITMPNVCQKLTVFDCLKSATAQCPSTDLGDVSYDDVKSHYSDGCQNVLPSTISPAANPGVDQCESFLICLNTSFTPAPIPSIEQQYHQPNAYYMASVTRTSTWCRYLRHNYQCVIDHGNECGVSSDTIQTATDKLNSINCEGATEVPETACNETCVNQCWAKFGDCADIYMNAVAPYRTAQQNFIQQHMSESTPLSEKGNLTMALQYACNDPANNVFDACGPLTQAKQCLDQNIGTECWLDERVGNAIAKFYADVETGCSPEAVCYNNHVLKCQCKVLTDVTQPLSNVCSNYDELKSCMDALPAVCSQDPAVSKVVDYAQAAYAGYNYVSCGQNGCPSAVTCVEGLADASEEAGLGEGKVEDDGYIHVSAQFSLLPQMKVPDVNMPNICPSAENSSGHLSVFDCLKTETAACNVDQGDVTMDDLKADYNYLCTEALPKVATIGECSAFMSCLGTFPLAQGLISLRYLDYQLGDLPNVQQMEAAFHFIGATTRSGTWCSWLRHNYQCVIDNQQACQVVPEAVTIATEQLANITCLGAATLAPPEFEEPTTTTTTTEDTSRDAGAAIGSSAFVILSVALLQLIL